MKGGVLVALALFCAAPARAQDAGFALDLRFDRVTVGTLVARGEAVVVSVFFYGEPNAEGEEHADEMGQVWLGQAEFTLAADDQRVTVPGNIDRGALKWVRDGAVRVNVNVFSARWTDENNILNCGIFEDDVRVAQAAVPVIDCTLLGS